MEVILMNFWGQPLGPRQIQVTNAPLKKTSTSHLIKMTGNENRLKLSIYS